MFIERYKLERNPFAEDSVRPLFVSQSMREVSDLIRQVGEGKLQSVLISGAAGVGKTTLVSQRIRGFRDTSVSWVGPDVETPLELMRKLVHDIGPGDVEGSREELRRILEVYLTHQRTNGRLSAIVLDGLERHRGDVVAEIRGLARLKVRHLPVLQLIVVTRNDDLVDDWLTDFESGGPARAQHVRLTGFTLEETHSYLRICLQNAGCDWANELFPDDVLLDVQALTQGVVGDINALCSDALTEVAKQTSGSSARALRVTGGLLRGVGARLRLHHDPSNWSRTIDETLSPDAVQVRDSRALRLESAHLIVSSGGRQLAEIKLDQPRMILGRDPACDISLESTYLSRFQNLFMLTERGWMIIDLNSTNGCFVNGRKVREHRLQDGDSISVGHHQLRFVTMDSKTRPANDPDHVVSPTDDTISADMEEERSRWSAPA
jgi:FHA domain/AAA domain